MSQSATTTAAAANMLNSIAAKENNYKQNIVKNHAWCKTLASRLVISDKENHDGNDNMVGSLEDVLMKANNSTGLHGSDGVTTTTTQSSSTSSGTVLDHDKIQKFLNEQRERLKSVARTNIENERSVVSFCSAIRTLKQQMETNTVDDITEGNMPDYQSIIETLMDKENTESVMNIQLEDELMYREVCAKLGEIRNANEDMMEEDGLMMMETNGVSNGTGNSSGQGPLKCPITGMDIDDEPVKNNICHHVYSRIGIMQHINQKKKQHTNCPCPVPGCRNMSVTVQQLVEDIESKIRIRQDKRRREMRNAESSTMDQGERIDDDDEEEEY